MTDNCFDNIARYFDAYIQWEKRLSFEMPFLIDLLEKKGAKSVLDIGCGSGRHAVELAKNGFRVVGIDTSACLLDTARSLADHIEPTPEFLEADATEIGGEPGELMGPDGRLEGERFDCCLLLGNTISLLGAETRVIDILGRVRDVLTPGGILITQMPNYHDRIKRRDPSTRFRIGTVDGEPCMLIKTLTYTETGADQPDVKLHLLRIINKDATFGLEDNPVQILALTYDSLEKLLIPAGFLSMGFLGSMDGREFDPVTSPDCIAIAGTPKV